MIPYHDSISAEGYTRNVWFYPAMTEEPHRLCLFLDAEHYVRDMKSLPVLRDPALRAAVPRMSFLFVSHVSGEARQHDYLCNPDYAKFLACDVVVWARKRVPLLDGDHVICGLSLSGLQAAFTALHHQEVFSRVLSQSGSFWWLAQNEFDLPPTKARVWLSVGDQETATGVSHPPTELIQNVSQIEGVEIVARRFRQLGAEVHFHLYSGGHSAAPWRDELGQALTWLFKGA